MHESKHPRDWLRFGDFELDPASGELRHAGSTNRLQPQPLKVLLTLTRNPGELVSREHLKQELMAGAPYGDIDHAINVAITKLRAALHDPPDKPKFIDTLHRRGYRFVAEVQASSAQPHGVDGRPPGIFGIGVRRSLVFVLALVVSLSLIFALLHRSNSSAHKHTVVVAAFTNSTGDPAFDKTLRPEFLAQLQQSHSLEVLPDEQIAHELSLMMRPSSTSLTDSLAIEVCQRTAGTATIHGAIFMIGNQYVLQLSAVNCRSGEVLAHEQVTFTSKEQVLNRTREVGSKIRKKLKKSLPPETENGTRTESVTTPSLEALKFYSLGRRSIVGDRDDAVSISLLQRAITLDPEFAMAHAQLGSLYKSVGESARASEALSKAYSLRQHVSTPEQLFIEAHYEHMVTGNLEAARQKYAAWIHLYPHDTVPLVNLASIYSSSGECDKAKPLLERALRIAPEDGTVYASLVSNGLCLGELDDARAVAREASARGADTPLMHVSLYIISFLQKNAAGMESEVSYLSGLPKWNAFILCMQARTAAYAGRFREALTLVRRGTDVALLSDQAETAANCHADAAEWEALVGNLVQARKQVRAALLFANSREVEAKSAIALALSGDPRMAAHLADELAGRFPEDTDVKFSYLPTIRGAIALQTGNSTEAVEILDPAAAYNVGNRLPQYLRGKAYLANGQETAAGRQFQEILTRSGIFASNTVRALAQLELGRTLLRAGDPEKALLAYKKFFAGWENADSDIPVMEQARGEYQDVSRVKTGAH